MMPRHRRIQRLLAALAFGAALVTTAAAQSQQELAEIRLQMGQLAEQVRQLTGEVERLRFQLQQVQGGAGAQPSFQTGQTEIIQDPAVGAPGAGWVNAPGANSSSAAAAPPSELGSVSVAQDDPRVLPDGVPGPAGAPLDLSALAGGAADFGSPGAPQAQPSAAPGSTPGGDSGTSGPQGQPGAATQPQVAALGGTANDQYDLAYGYVLTGDYGMAEQSFRQWLQANPGHALAGDAEFWLAESLLRQNKSREAANMFLKLYKGAPQGRKAPDSLAKLGIALAALGEQSAACATFQELDRKHPEASPVIKSQVAAEAQRAGC